MTKWNLYKYSYAETIFLYSGLGFRCDADHHGGSLEISSQFGK